jgi:hypothetical protein
VCCYVHARTRQDLVRNAEKSEERERWKNEVRQGNDVRKYIGEIDGEWYVCMHVDQDARVSRSKSKFGAEIKSERNQGNLKSAI